MGKWECDNVEQAAARAGVAKNTVYAYLRKRLIRYVWRWKRVRVLNIKDIRRVKSQQPAGRPRKGKS